MKRPSTGKAVVLGLILGLLIGWIPIVGALLVGLVAGKKARTTVGAILATVIPAAAFGGASYWFSSHPIKLGGQETTIGSLGILGPITAACMIGSAMMAARPGVGRLFGLLAVIGGWSMRALRRRPFMTRARQSSR